MEEGVECEASGGEYTARTDTRSRKNKVNEKKKEHWRMRKIDKNQKKLREERRSNKRNEECM